MFSKQTIAALVAEFVGTMVLALSVLSIVNSQLGVAFFVALGAGLALLLMVFSIGNISGAHINPAVSFGFWTIRKISTVKMVLYIVFQMLGGLAALYLFQYLAGSDLPAGQVKGYDSQIMVAEVVGTAVFTFGIAAAVLSKLNAGAKAAAIGGSLTLGIIIASVASPAFLNPAVSLANNSLTWETASNFALGPILGGIIGFNLYTLLFSASTSQVSETVAKTKPVVVEAKVATASKTSTQKSAKKSTPKKK